MSTDCRILAGKVYVRDLSVADQPLLFIGNAQAGIAITESEQTLPDYTSSAGGNACAIKTIDKVELELTFYAYNMRNLALACFGTADTNAGDTVTAEALNAFGDAALNQLAHVPTVGTVVVSVGLTDYTEDTDYTVVGGGFVVIDGSPLAIAIAAGTGDPKHLAVTVAYTYAAEDTMDALTTSGKTFQVVVDGKNRADGNKPEIWDLYQCQFGPTDKLTIITRDFGSFNAKAEVIADTSKPDGEGQYFFVKKPSA